MKVIANENVETKSIGYFYFEKFKWTAIISKTPHEFIHTLPTPTGPHKARFKLTDLQEKQTHQVAIYQFEGWA